MFVISVKANTSSGVTVTLTNTIAYNLLNTIVFTWCGIYAFEVDCDANKKFLILKRTL